MKKIKFFALAIMAMLSINAFAQTSTMKYRYQVIEDDKAQILGYTTDWPTADMATTVIPATLADGDDVYKVVSIAAGAFSNNENITAIDFSAAEDLVEIEAGAFAGTPITSLDLSATKLVQLLPLFETLGAKVTEIKLPATLEQIGYTDAQVEGLGLEEGEHAQGAFEGLSKLTSLVIPGGEEITIAAYAFYNTMRLTTLTLPGKVTIEEGAFTRSYISTLNISGDLEEVEEGAFVQNGTQEITLNYTPSELPEAVEFDQAAFGAEEATKYVTFNTTDEEYLAMLVDLWTLDGSYGVKKLGDAPEDPEEEDLTIDVYNNGGSYAYGSISLTELGTETGIKIAKKQGTANVMVYGAYFDDGGTVEKSAILMDQLHLIGGYYYLPVGEGENAFVVKSSSEEPVVYEELDEEDAGKDSRNYDADGKEQNNIMAWHDGACYAIDIIDLYREAEQTVYFLRDLAGDNGEKKPFGWRQREDDSVISDGQLFLVYPVVEEEDGGEEGGEGEGPVEPARVIWLDGSEEDATAIKTVKKANADKNVIYNVAGQKVNAAYKGLVIKDGKKYIQK